MRARKAPAGQATVQGRPLGRPARQPPRGAPGPAPWLPDAARSWREATPRWGPAAAPAPGRCPWPNPCVRRKKRKNLFPKSYRYSQKEANRAVDGVRRTHLMSRIPIPRDYRSINAVCVLPHKRSQSASAICVLYSLLTLCSPPACTDLES